MSLWSADLALIRPGNKWIFENFWRNHKNAHKLVYKVLNSITGKKIKS